MAIGGGELKGLETLPIDTRIVELTGKKRPRALFLPTASGDSDEYIETFTRVYGKKLGCRTRTLKLVKNPPSFREVSDAVLSSDLVYVGGGNTLRMMKIWRRVGLDRILREANSRGIILSGLSAGGICWFSFGHSDSRRFSGEPDWDYIRVRGLGLVGALFCPHYHAKQRQESLSRMVSRCGGVAVACDNNAAIEILGDSYRVLVSSRTARAYRVFKKRGTVLAERLSAGKEPRPLEGLLRKRVR